MWVTIWYVTMNYLPQLLADRLGDEETPAKRVPSRGRQSEKGRAKQVNNQLSMQIKLACFNFLLPQ